MNAIAQDLTNDAALAQYPNGLRAFTFWISETLYAIDIAKVLTISQNVANVQNMPASGKGLLGMTEFQDHAIPVVDFANMLNMKSGTEVSQDLAGLLSDKEKDHHDWLDSLEKSLTEGIPFTKPKDPHQCAFGKWYDHFHSRDESLMIIMKDFDDPHKRIHKLADELLEMRFNGDVEGALRILRLEREITMKRLSRHFSQAKEQINDFCRAVLLYLTEDGVTPSIALRIDEINDVIDFKPDQFKPMNQIRSVLKGDEGKLIMAYIKQKNTSNCLLIDASKVNQVMT